MGKFGKRNTVSENITDYNICILGLPGIGKTTLMKDVCEKLVTDEGYIILNMGKEDGISCIDGVIYENVENWKKFEEVTKDIIKNKATDYPDLKIIVLDTIDQLFDMAEQQVIKMHNAEKIKEKNFTPINTINAAFGGYGAGLEKTCQIVLDKIWDLKKAGLAVWMCGHTKNKDIVDPLTDQTYTTISANLSQKYFNAIKTKMHIVGMAVIDRDIVTESTGRKDIHNKDVTRNKVVSEARKIVFRDDNYGVDSKSRFKYITEEIPLDADAFIKAVQDAIYSAEKEGTTGTKKKPVKAPVVEEVPELDVETETVEEEVEEETVEAETVEEDELDLDTDEEEVEEEEEDIDALREKARELYKKSGTKIKAQIKEILKPYGKMADADIEGLKEILALAE